MDPFAAALDALFSAPGSAAAVYQPQDGPAFDLRVIRGQPDRMTSFGSTKTIMGSNSFEIMRSTVARPAAGDLICVGSTLVAGQIVGGEVFELLGEPIGDVEGLTWTVGAEPYRP